MKKFIIIGHTDKYEIETNDISDGYHTMNELYNHRMALNVALFNIIDVNATNIFEVFKAKYHYDGTMYEGGYFIVVLLNHRHDPPKQVSYHYHLKHWDKFQIPSYEKCPYEYDGHTPNDTINNLLEL